MPSHRIEARPPRGTPGGTTAIVDPDRLRLVVEDAAHVAGHTPALTMPANEADVADVLRTSASVLAVGAQSSLTGGATPRGEVVLSTSRLRGISLVEPGRARVGAGVTLAELDEALVRSGGYYPPGPTYDGAFLGGTVATNAAGPATFKYGTTRDWVEAITVVLASGDVLDVERGSVRAHPDGYFEILMPGRTVRVPVPRYHMPSVPKISAGYFAAPGMDLIDLFVGAEGTLGVITEVTVRVRRTRPAWCIAFVPFPDRTRAIDFVREMQTAARETWRTGDPAGLDVSAIEHLDARCLDLAREDGIDRRAGLRWPDSTAMALIVTLELPPDMTADRAFAQIGAAGDPGAADSALGRFCHALAGAGVLDDVEMAVPGDRARAAQILTLREEVPASVNRRVGRAKQDVDARIEKTAADMIVPFDRIDDLLALYDAEFRRRGLDVAIWGHISDGNLHPNVLPRSFGDMEAGKAAILDLGRAVIRMGGSPLAEHGVGRNPIKQQLLETLYGREGIDDMHAVKRALDPDNKLAPGVIFAG